MTAFVHAYCRNGDVHIGHMTEWGNGSAVIGGTRIDGVAFIDAAPVSGGGQTGPAPVASDTHRTRTSRVAPAIAATFVEPVGAPSVTDGQGKPAGPADCRCGCERDAHSRAAWYCAYCPCDRYRPDPTTTNGAAASPATPL